ncbi:hypothetical protein HFP15_07355 [Amycolatopsis sp. K13G38]|uniref:SHOCT domain-containing protein n=1 Tax=Amycolatopsis acididurans TaxID=2724524 RepID=A0ABX1IYU7_9PSEU|nr:hypothetical protein [Amycolatopsis acididurans]NKQ52695.1 hypothetical protein [Amycolatopsis acididurans]
MMYWYGNGMNGWGYALMSISGIVFWVLLIFGGIALFRYFNRERASTRQSPEDLLAERFARGEIDEQEYQRGLDLLRHRSLKD